ncbi:MAG: DegT/DnrJ/EryC1/StrS family aminotransferase [Candidatus Omnitrophica bacterium]|nr:DegT/DnrJ/EryC1/StrS family aminotransferase [Candidatus Omnitrophota bacterium]
MNEVVKTIKSGWIGTGPKTHLFEEKIRKYIGSKFAIALNSCTAGLHLALDVIGVSDKDEVITTPLTFPSTANVIIHHHAKPVFVDVELTTGNIDPLAIEKAITKKTKAIIPVHLYGRPCNMELINKIAKKYKLFVIEDAAHALEAKFKEKKIGTISDFTAFSFYVTKNLTTAEGGMLTTNNAKWANEARIRSLHGISKDAWKRYSSSGFTPYETFYPGYKYNMIDLQASLGLHQVDKIWQLLKTREKYWRLYNDAFKDIKEVQIPAETQKNIKHARHLYTLLLNINRLKIGRNHFIDALKAENIGAGIHFTALHLHKFYREKFGFKKGTFLNAEYIGERTVSLPLSPLLTQQDINDVIEAVRKIITYYKK